MLSYLYENFAITTRQRIIKVNLFQAYTAEWWRDSFISPMQHLNNLHLQNIRNQLEASLSQEKINTRAQQNSLFSETSNPIYQWVYNAMQDAKQNPSGIFQGQSYYYVKKGLMRWIPDFTDLLIDQNIGWLNKINNVTFKHFVQNQIDHWSSFDLNNPYGQFVEATS